MISYEHTYGEQSLFTRSTTLLRVRRERVGEREGEEKRGERERREKRARESCD